MDEGYIKFNCEVVEKECVEEKDIIELNKWRNVLFEKGLIGMYESGIGFGNISIRKNNGFIISGSATGNIKYLTKEHYSFVDEINFEKNYLKCYGKIRASSESLTHAAVYESNENINAVIHIHNLEMWSNLMNKIPTTNPKVPYGTPEMSYEVKRLFKETNVLEEKIFAMGGHEEGIISFGKNLDDSGEVLLKKL